MIVHISVVKAKSLHTNNVLLFSVISVVEASARLTIVAKRQTPKPPKATALTWKELTDLSRNGYGGVRTGADA